MKLTGMIRMIGVAVAVSAPACMAADSGVVIPAQNFVTNVVSVAPSNATVYAELKAREAGLIKQRQAIELKLNKVFFGMKEARQGAMRQDAELNALAKEIQQKQVALEKRAAEKYPEFGKQAQERDALTKSFSEIGLELREVRAKMDGMMTIKMVQ